MISTDDKVPVAGFQCWVDLKEMIFYEVYRHRISVVTVHDPIDYYGYYVLIRKIGARNRKPVRYKLLLELVEKVLLNKQEQESERMNLISPRRSIQTLSKNPYGIISCPDCNYLQPKENFRCVKCDQSLHF